VLIIDDDSDHLLLSKLLLQKDGHTVLTAGNTHDAFELLANHPVSIVISDQNMPEMSGVEFLRRVKLMYPEIVRIMLSGVGDFGTATAAINEGEVHKFFVKGRDEDLLRREIRLKIRHVPDKLRGPLQ
jgi:response regulator RpfG family c-di-GMP phosphodiesterase